MKSKYFDDVARKLKSTYQLDVIEDIILAREDRVILFADTTHGEDVELNVVSGSLEVIGYHDAPSINLSTILTWFDFNNSYGEVAGHQAYFHGVKAQLYDFKQSKDVSFPIRYKNHRKWLRFNITPSTKNQNISIFTLTDVTKLHTQEEETFAKTHHDSLTKLFNKYSFDYHYGLMYNQPGFHVMYMDLDNFKTINDRFGHGVGNQCLIAFAHILKQHQTDVCRFYRLGGDEFLGLMIGGEPSVRQLAQTITETTRTLQIANTPVQLTVSIGVMKATKSHDLARKADDLMYRVKLNGKNNFLYEIEAA